MIIACPCGDKKFNVDASLIPAEGRMLQCGFCEKKWHYKLDDAKLKNEYKKKELKIKKIDPYENIPEDVDKIITDAENSSITINSSPLKKNFNIPFLNLFLLSVISIISLIIVIDTFKNPINNILPGFNFFLNSFYESVKDLYLFFKDLIR